MTSETKWKFLYEQDGAIKSQHGDAAWTVGEWKREDRLALCYSGFHASDRITDAFKYVCGNVLAEVETRGESILADDKSVHQGMRLVRCYRWRKEDSAAYAVKAARLALPVFEERYPRNPAPRNAIEAAEHWLADPSEANVVAAGTPHYAAYAAADAARAAAYAADAAHAAHAADAADAAHAAVHAVHAASAATNAADAVSAELEAWMQARVAQLEIIETTGEQE
jgi:hypothetical protein